jgi:hypothetical protein
MALTNFRASPLPNPPLQYDAQYMRQMIRVIELYFGQLDSNTPNYAQSYTADNFYGSGVGIYVPYNQFYSMVDQAATATDESYAVELEETSFTNGISITGVDNTRITFSEPGIYTITYSLAFKNTTNDSQDIDIWFRYAADGVTPVDVANSNSKFSVAARKATTDPSYLVAVTAFTGFAEAADVWIEIMWRVSNTGVTIEHLDEQTFGSLTIPATPSAIVQANFVSKAV